MDYFAEIEITCPHCGETWPLAIDTSQARQTMIEDCTVCCRPINLSIESQPGEVLQVTVER